MYNWAWESQKVEYDDAEEVRLISRQESTTGSLMVIARSFLCPSSAALFQSHAFPPGLGDAGMDLSRIAMALVEVEEEDGMENFLLPANKLNELALAQMSHW